MKNYGYCIITLLVLFSCSKPIEDPIKEFKRSNNPNPQTEFHHNNPESIAEIINLPIGSTLFELKEEIDPYLFGYFYNNRFACYLVDDISVPFQTSEITNVALFYVDNVLLKKKFILNNELPNIVRHERNRVRIKALSLDAANYVRSGASLIDSLNTLIMPGGYAVTIDNDDELIIYKKNEKRKEYTYEVKHKLFFNYLKMAAGTNVTL